MATSLIKRCDLLGSLVIDQNTAEDVGNIAQLLVNIRTHKIEQVKCTSGFLGCTARYFEWNNIRPISKDVILVDGLGKATAEQPEATGSMVGLEVWSESGAKIGMIGDYYLNLATGMVTDYIFVLNNFKGIAGGAHRLPPTAVINTGHQRMIIMDEVLQSAERFSEGLEDRLTQAFAFITEDYTQTVTTMAAVV